MFNAPLKTLNLVHFQTHLILCYKCLKFCHLLETSKIVLYRTIANFNLFHEAQSLLPPLSKINNGLKVHVLINTQVCFLHLFFL